MSINAEFEKLYSLAEQKLNELKKQNDFEQNLLESMPSVFEKNLIAFSHYVPQVAEQFRNYKKLTDIKFFCSPTGKLNIIDPGSNCPLYGDDPVEQCKVQVDKASENPNFSTIAFGQENEALSEHFIHAKYLRKIYNKFLEQEGELEKLTVLPEHIGSSIVFGVGLGYHLNYLVEKVTIDHLYICEPNLDLFFASLFICDWVSILEKIDERDGVVVFNIGVSFEQFSADFINEMKHRGAFNSVSSLLYQHYPSEELTKIIKKFHKDFHMVAVGWGFFDDGVISIAHDYHNAKAELPTLKKNAKFPKVWRGMPAFIVANGPSLDLAIEEIKRQQGSVVVFSCGSALIPLLKHGIIPDFHVALERTRFTFDYYNEFIDKDIIEQLNFLTVNVMHPRCSELFGWTGMGFKTAEPGTTISSEFIDRREKYSQLVNSNPVVANTAAAFVCNMGFEEVYLMGVDGGYKDPKYHHSKSSSYFNDDGTEKKEIAELIVGGEIRVPGNFADEVYTTAFFNVGNAQLGELFRKFPNINVFNCSDGARIENTTPLKIDDILFSSNLPNKPELIQFIKEDIFIKHKFNDEEYKYWLAIDEFDSICDGLVQFVDRDFETRSEIATALKLQVRFLYSYGLTRYRHIYFLLDGSLTYVHAVFRMMLYSFQDEQATVDLFNEARQYFIEYLIEAKNMYHDVLDATHEKRSYIMGMLSDEDE